MPAIGVVTLLVVQRRLPREAVFTTAVVTTGAAIVGAGAVSSLTPALLLVALVGAGAGCAYVTGFTVMQESVTDDMRGRTSRRCTRSCACVCCSRSRSVRSSRAVWARCRNAVTDGSVKFGSVHLSLPGRAARVVVRWV